MKRNTIEDRMINKLSPREDRPHPKSRYAEDPALFLLLSTSASVQRDLIAQAVQQKPELLNDPMIRELVD